MKSRLLKVLCILVLTLSTNVTREADIFFKQPVKHDEQPVQQIVEIAPKSRPEEVSRSRRGYSVIVTATAYTPHDEGCTGIAYDGRPAIPYRTIAVDPKVIPLGSRVFINGFGWMLAHDIGGAIQGKIIDICVPDTKTAFTWGRKRVEVYVEPPIAPYRMNW